MEINALVDWYGSKRRLAPRIVEELGPHQVYWELFCGSLAVLNAKPRCRMETVNDRNGDLVNLARIVRNGTWGPRLYRWLRRTLVHEAVFADSAKALAAQILWTAGPAEALTLTDLERAYHFYVVSWLGRNGFNGTQQKRLTICVRYTGNGGAPARRFVGAVDSLPAWRRRLREVFILDRCGVELAESIDDARGTAIYADPPYLHKSARYLHDFDKGQPDAPHPLVRTFGTHGRLALALRRFKAARVVVSYYDHPALAHLYPGWRKVDVSLSKSLTAANKEGAKVAPEVLLVNGKE